MRKRTQELSTFLQLVGGSMPSKRELELAMRTLDTDDSGGVSAPELLAWWKKRCCCNKLPCLKRRRLCPNSQAALANS